jgi:hypothetical protein
MLLLCGLQAATAQTHVPADTVLWFAPGTGQSVGQGPVFFPRNVLGMPDTSARIDKPSVDPRTICSIGLGGDIVLGFAHHAVVNGPGTDFVVYENAFRYAAGRIYAEPATVQVSQDGLTWHPFPFDRSTLEGCAGVTPTDPQLPHGGGDAFDLAAVGMDSVRWIRLTDITQTLLDDPGHALFDPTLSGFDLDAVVALHHVPIVDAPRGTFDATTERLSVGLPPGQSGVCRFFDLRGTLLHQQHIDAGITGIDAASLPPGYVMIQIVTAQTAYVMRVLR